jgi:hypothetical protein
MSVTQGRLSLGTVVDEENPSFNHLHNGEEFLACYRV